ncbi:helix-turn-helix domain-containing protein [Vallitalea okinawensis]|uniref:helix-turn-helix domain-containing protein n=1 Tax=Vallitalea okinawensis TaxID=2078660 RepID=UPI000CFD0357|nr:helix-turn-helix domain-containing protein [Vallitalea okinawensis]
MLKNKSLYFKLLFNLLILMIIITLTTGALSYYLISSALKQNAYDYNTEVLYQTKQVTDVILDEISKMALELTVSQDIERLILAPWSIEDNYNQLKNITSLLENRLQIFNYIYSIYIYDETNNRVITDIGITDLDVFSDRGFIEANMNDDNFYYWTSSRTLYKTTHVSNEVISLVMSLPLSSTNTRGMLVINIDQKAVYDDYININNEKLGNIHVIDDNDNIIFSKDDKQIISSLKTINQHIQQGETGSFIVKDGRDNNFVSSIQGDNGWKYISIMPYNQVFKNALIVIKITLTICFICLLLGIALALFVSKKYYSPIRKLTEDILDLRKDGVDMDKDKDFNELGYIKGSFDCLCKENEQIKLQFEQNELILKEYFLLSLINGNVTDESTIIHDFDYYNIPMTLQGYVAMVLKINHMNQGKTAKEQNLTRYKIKLLCGECIQEVTKGIVIDTSLDNYVLILNLDQVTEKKAMEDICHSVAEAVSSRVKQQVQCETFISIGSYYESIEDISLSLKEAERNLEYKCLVAGENVISHGEDKFLQRRSKDIQKFEKESKQLLYSIKKGKSSCEQVEVEPMLEELLRSKSISVQHKYFLLMRLINQLITLIVELNGDIDTIFHSNLNLYTEFGQLRSLEEIKEWFNQAISNLQDFISQKQDNQNVELINQIKAYMQEHYTEPLTLDIISDEFHISRSYFSKLFKDQMNTTFLNYLNEIRIEKASTLLIETKDNIVEIAEKTGYLNKQNIIRAFKKYYNMTPTEYRKKMKE